MITIATGDLVGILSDVIPFAHPDDELPTLHAIRLEWSGSALHALATDRYRIGWSAWSPDDDPVEERQEDLFTKWGGADDPWAATITLADAKHLVSTYKLKGKGVYYTPLTVEHVYRSVRIMRSKDTGHSAISTTVEDLFVKYPNLRELLASNDTVGPVTGTSFNAKLLADFAKVRPRGPLHMQYTNGRFVHLSIGDRFVGAIMAVDAEGFLVDAPAVEPAAGPEGGGDDNRPGHHPLGHPVLRPEASAQPRPGLRRQLQPDPDAVSGRRQPVQRGGRLHRRRPDMGEGRLMAETGIEWTEPDAPLTDEEMAAFLDEIAETWDRTPPAADIRTPGWTGQEAP